MTNEEAIEILEANRPDPCYQMLREAVDFAVNALKAQIDKDIDVPSNDDIISRQAAINEIEYELEMINSALDSITLDFNARERLRQRRGEAREILNSIQQLPSAQPEPTTEIQEILNYLDTTLHPIVSPDNWNVYAELHDMVSKLPSAQPEPHYDEWCTDCKEYDHERHCCPRWNKVIKQTVEDLKGADRKWIPCVDGNEPKANAECWISTNAKYVRRATYAPRANNQPNGFIVTVGSFGFYEYGKSAKAWMPYTQEPEPYREEGESQDES